MDHVINNWLYIAIIITLYSGNLLWEEIFANLANLFLKETFVIFETTAQ